MKKAQGFTLVEMLMALAIGSVTLTVGVNSMQDLVTRQRVDAYTGNILQSIHSARQHAILKHQPVTVCASEDGQTCNDNWSTGHLLFIDHNGNRELDENDEILNHINGSSPKDPVHWRSFRVADTLQFLPTGMTSHQNGTFTVCGLGKADHARAVIITKMGRPRMSTDSNGDGIDEGADGRPLRC
ncbi:prepilin-type N-terminal cleavage/methylation domain-containing protein [Permianibacter sp. IMCC34836]|uniref:GspH/FimT family pseudopilin n=1 Tax=Permianibacter fluminis TaxID=2738515 RepID=UPI0015538016|nr:GspH/FimT family pseudopilin [Permianibacter fluminis]NQD37699.1 prepilin-type N-terminal cleavage/methylation domain-containing protein [Permianibacter fluminis]